MMAVAMERKRDISRMLALTIYREVHPRKHDFRSGTLLHKKSNPTTKETA
jgi:hypothetical protein